MPSLIGTRPDDAAHTPLDAGVWPRAWHGHWIDDVGVGDAETAEPVFGTAASAVFARTLYRRRFDLDAVPATARLRLTADSRYLLYVNGVEVGRGPVRSQPRRLHYDAYDIRPALRAGENVIVVLVTYYGRANSFWQPAAANETLGRRGVLVAEGEFDGNPALPTDGTWETQPGPGWRIAEGKGMDGVPVEVVDARLVHPAWREGHAGRWHPAHIVPARHLGSLARSQPPTDPYGALSPRPIGPLGETRVVPATATLSGVTSAPVGADPVTHVLAAWRTVTGAVRESSPRRISFAAETGRSQAVCIDIGRVTAGLVTMEVVAPRGTVIDLLYREYPASDEEDHFLSTPRTGARYIARGEDDVFEALETNGFRYLCLLVRASEPGEVTVSGLSVRERLYPAGTGSFRSADDELDRLYAAAVRTVELNAQDGYIDCPTREQRAWVGDGVVHQSVHLTTSDDWRMARWYVELGDSPRADGILPMSVVGEIESSGGNTIPDWSLNWVHGLHNLLRYTGDDGLLARHAPTARRVLEWYVPYLDRTGVLADVPEWNLVDWSSILLNGRSSILTAMWARGLRDYAEISDRLGNAGDARWARSLHRAASAGYEAFWDERRGTYVDHVVDGEPHPAASQLAGALAVVSGLAPRDRFGRVLAWIADPRRQVTRSWIGGHGGYDTAKILDQLRGVQTVDWDAEEEVVVAEPFAAAIVHDAYAEAGRPDLVVTSLRRWSEFLVDGYDTFGECWGWGTPVHGWSATPARDLIAFVLGVTPAEPGFVRARIDPAYDAVARVEGSAPTPYGWIHVAVVDGDVEVDSPVPFDLTLPDGRVERRRATR